MRPDHNKLVCEHERHNSHFGYHHSRHLKTNSANDDFYDYEEGDELIQSPVRQEPMKRPHQWTWWNEKEGMAYMAPLHGFIRKNVGRKWNDVYSDLCRQYDKRSVVNKHYLHDYIEDIVALRTVEHNGKLYIGSKYGSVPWDTLDESYSQYYVDPQGILRYNKQYVSHRTSQRRRYRVNNDEKMKKMRVIDKLTELHLVDDVWYEYKFIEQEGVPNTTKYTYTGINRVFYATEMKYPYRYDLFLKETVRAKRIAVSRRTLSKKELKKYKLNRNDIKEVLVA